MSATTSEPFQRVYRNVSVLAVAQGLFMSVQGMGIATSPLAGYALLGADKSLGDAADLSQSRRHHADDHSGVAADGADRPAGRVSRSGRMLGVLFGLLGAYAMWRQDFWLLCVAALLQGASAAFAWYYRFRRRRCLAAGSSSRRPSRWSWPAA